MKTSHLKECDHAHFLSQSLWHFQSLQQFTDLTLVCCDGQVQMHKAILGGILKCLLTECFEGDLECLIVPHVTAEEVEEALECLYIRLDAKPILYLLRPEGLTNNDDKTIESLNVKNQETFLTPFEEGDQIDEKFEVKLRSPEMDEIKEEANEFAETDVEEEPTQDAILTKINPYKTKCPHCDVYIKGKKSYRKHLKEYHDIEDTIIESKEAQCQICGKTLKHKQTLKNHIKEVHGDKTYTCTMCGISLSCQRNLTTHMIIHTKPSIPCDQCGKLFKRKYAVKSHIKKFHLQIKNFLCDQCDKRFADAKHFREHVIAVHDKLKPFGCEVCRLRQSKEDWAQ